MFKMVLEKAEDVYTFGGVMLIYVKINTILTVKLKNKINLKKKERRMKGKKEEK